MIATFRFVLFLLIAIAMPTLVAHSQSREIVVQAASENPTVRSTTSQTTATTQTSDSLQSALKLLAEIKAANEATLKKQEAVLQQLDDLQKAADQIKIFGKRD
jgi:hypothetical protein